MRGFGAIEGLFQENMNITDTVNVPRELGKGTLWPRLSIFIKQCQPDHHRLLSGDRKENLSWQFF